MRGILIVSACIVFGPLLTWTGYSHKQLLSRLETEGVTVYANLEGGEVRSGHKGAKIYKVKVTYSGGGQSMEQEMPVTKAYFESIIAGDFMRVETIILTYLNSDPKQAIIVGGTPDKEVELWMGVILTIVGLGGVAWYLKGLASGGFGDV